MIDLIIDWVLSVVKMQPRKRIKACATFSSIGTTCMSGICIKILTVCCMCRRVKFPAPVRASKWKAL